MTGSKHPSIRKQLLLWFLIPILGLILLSIFSSYYLAQGYANTAFDDGLEETAKAVAGQVQFQNGQWRLASPELAKAISAHEINEKLYFLISLPNGQIIGGNPGLGVPSPGFRLPDFRTMRLDHQDFRVVSLQIPLPHRTQDAYLWVQVGETLIGRNKLVHEILIHTIGHQLILFLLVAICILLGLNKGLLPLEKLQKEVASRSPKDLRRLEEASVPKEVLPLVKNLNDLMQQLESHWGMQQRFVANAAHQLRTPLAGLKMQLELTQRQSDPMRVKAMLGQMESSLERSIHLSQKLLTLAKIESGVFSQVAFEPVNINPLIEKVIELYAPMAIEKAIELSLEMPDEPVLIQGDALSLQELMSNLLDNAIRYTPSEGAVSLQVQQQSRSVIVIVEDTGPGIPQEERPKVFERFYRANLQELSGSGLGLAIVQEIVLAHQAKIQIEDGTSGKGTKVIVGFKNLI